jgi:hypothetical protein
MEGSCSTGQSPQWAVVPVEEEEEEVPRLRYNASYLAYDNKQTSMCSLQQF